LPTQALLRCRPIFLGALACCKSLSLAVDAALQSAYALRLMRAQRPQRACTTELREKFCCTCAEVIEHHKQKNPPCYDFFSRPRGETRILEKLHRRAMLMTKTARTTKVGEGKKRSGNHKNEKQKLTEMRGG